LRREYNVIFFSIPYLITVARRDCNRAALSIVLIVFSLVNAEGAD
jgi:hypothetical protein